MDVSSAEQKEVFQKVFPLKPLSWKEYIHYKYLLDLDGYAASTPGLAWKLLSGCAVLKRDSRFTVWFSRALKPKVHYVPWDGTTSDLFQKLQRMRVYDTNVKTIADNGRAFAQENILSDHAYLYCYKVLLMYASRQNFIPSL